MVNSGNYEIITNTEQPTSLGHFAIEDDVFKITKNSDFLSRYRELDGQPVEQAERAIANWMHSSRIKVVESDEHPKADDLIHSKNYLDRLIATKMQPNAGQITHLAADPHEEVRLSLAKMHGIPKKVIDKLVQDKSIRVRSHVMDSRNITPAMVKQMLPTASTGDLHSFLRHPQIDQDTVDAILEHPNATFGIKSDVLSGGMASAEALVKVVQEAVHHPTDENLSLLHAALNSPEMPEKLLGDLLMNANNSHIRELAGSNYRIGEEALQQLFINPESDVDTKRYVLAHNPNISPSIAALATNDPDPEVRAMAQKITENLTQSDTDFGGQNADSA